MKVLGPGVLGLAPIDLGQDPRGVGPGHQVLGLSFSGPKISAYVRAQEPGIRAWDPDAHAGSLSTDV